jgi:hypothetical protein
MPRRGSVFRTLRWTPSLATNRDCWASLETGSDGFGEASFRRSIRWTLSAEEIATRVPMEGLALPRSTRLSIEELRPVRSARDCSVNPCSLRSSLIRWPTLATVSSAPGPTSSNGVPRSPSALSNRHPLG